MSKAPPKRPLNRKATARPRQPEPPHQPPPQMHRQGPRPLPLHLSLSLGSWLSSPLGLMLSTGASLLSKSQLPPQPLPKNPNQFANQLLAKQVHASQLQFSQHVLKQLLPEPLASLAQSLSQQNPSEVAPSLSRAVGENLAKFVRGIERYRTHPYQRPLAEPPTVWREGSARLLDYGSGKGGQPALFVPSLINRAYVLDLDEQRSLMRFLAQNGIRPYLLDWGIPSEGERSFGIDAYVSRLHAALAQFKQPPHLVGYCMGGNLALAAALTKPELIRSLALLATPWDFHADEACKAEALRAALLYKSWRPGCSLVGELPVDLIQTLFALLNPLTPQRKFMALADETDEDEVRDFVVLEDWLNDGVPLTLPVADSCIYSWYERNDPARGEWQVLGQTIDPKKLLMPALVIVPENDRIVTPTSALALANALPSRTIINVPLGHIGMIVSHAAPAYSWGPLLAWLRR